MLAISYGPTNYYSGLPASLDYRALGKNSVAEAVSLNSPWETGLDA